MDASSVFTLAILLVSCLHLSSQVLNEEDRNSTSVRATTDAPIPQIKERNATAHKNCTTATGVAGNCIIRKYCIYGTTAIDFTLYASKGYMKPCKVDEACCPFNYQLPEISTYNHSQTKKDFEFDDDD